MGYYLQAVGGQLELVNKRRPIKDIVADPATPAPLRDKLARVMAIRNFASSELHLPNNGSYRGYADLGRDFVVWNVFATEEFSITPHQWCFPITGCVPYRGYFMEAKASAFAQTLPKDKYDVFVGGVPAYSTLGYFNDPILNTFVHYPDLELARLIFHELAHQVVFVSGDAMFNESFATAVEEAGVARWMETQPSVTLHEQWDLSQRRREEFQSLVLRYQERLGTLYESNLAAGDKRARKAQVFDELRADYAALKTSWGGFRGYDRWFAQDLNNAHIAAIAVYNAYVPAFHQLLARARGDFASFFHTIAQLATANKTDRDARLAALMPDSNRATVHSPQRETLQ